MREQYMRSGEGFLMVFSIIDKNRCATHSFSRMLAWHGEKLIAPQRKSACCRVCLPSPRCAVCCFSNMFFVGSGWPFCSSGQFRGD